ncbi:histidine kinase [Chitinophaga skermanii]|uniref:Histidine kinase n=1 Tax=Chitinophaga skermanii TaxID=331697 RepID=A0A327R4L8_9BACT|nr:histidine kinase [Chitinophaga skermanii]RAJ08827.1 histidine kinase [Chitinophaga skermanii]
MIQLNNSRLGKKSLYALYWFLYIILFGFIQGGQSNDYKNAFAGELISLPLRVIFVAIVCEILMEKYLFKKRILAFLVAYVPLLILFSIFQRIIDNAIILEYFLTHWQKEPIFLIPPFLYSIIKLQFVVTIPFSVKLFYNWVMEQNRAMKIAEEKTQAELNLLRNQFHPHFIFNVLNTLYAKTMITAPASAEIVQRISSLLRFSIYEVGTKKIPLSKEIQYLEDYISLQKARFDHHVEISFNVEGGPLDGQYIEPFLVVPFVENSFKHCMHSDPGESWITMYISIQPGWLTAQIENSVPPKVTNNHDTHHGIGLENVRKRLDLLYEDKHTLKITQTAESFFVYLKVKLAAHDEQ